MADRYDWVFLGTNRGFGEQKVLSLALDNVSYLIGKHGTWVHPEDADRLLDIRRYCPCGSGTSRPLFVRLNPTSEDVSRRT